MTDPDTDMSIGVGVSPVAVGDLVRPYRAGFVAPVHPTYTGLGVRMIEGRPVIVTTFDIPWDAVGLVLETQIGRRGYEGGTPEDALVLFPQGLCRVPNDYLCGVDQ